MPSLRHHIITALHSARQDTCATQNTKRHMILPPVHDMHEDMAPTCPVCVVDVRVLPAHALNPLGQRDLAGVAHIPPGRMEGHDRLNFQAALRHLSPPNVNTCDYIFLYMWLCHSKCCE